MTARVKNIDWLATVLYPLAVVLMEAFWVYPWLTWIGNWSFFTQPRPALSLVSIIIVLALAILVIRLVLRTKWSVGTIRTTVVVSGLVVIFVVTGIEYSAGYGFLSGRWFAHLGDVFANIIGSPDTIVVALPVLLYLWWRGTGLGQSTTLFRSIYNSFLLGLTTLIVLIIVWQISSSSSDFNAPGTDVAINVMAFFFFGLLAIAISHLYLMRSSMPKEEAGLTSVWRWLPIMLSVIGGMVLVVFGITGFFSSGFFASVGHGFSIFWEFVIKIFNYILVPFNFLFEGIFRVLRWIVELLRGKDFESQEMSANGTAQNIFPETATKDLPPELYLVIKWLVIALIIAAVIFILAKAVSRYRARRAEEGIEEVHESLFSWRNLADDLRELFRNMGKRFQRKPASPFTALDGDEGDYIRDVREIYRRLLRESSRSGITRRRHETPVEYSGRLGRQVPESRESLADLTDIYMGVRYGEVRPPEERVNTANRLWRTLKGIITGRRENYRI